MAGKNKAMSQIKQVLRLHKDGETNRAIARKLNLYKGTVNKYVKLAEADPLSIDELLGMDDPVLEKHFYIGNPAYSDKRFDDLQERLPYIIKELGRKHVTRYILWQEYKSERPDGYEYTQFCYHIDQYVGARELSFVMSPSRGGGEYLYVDFSGDTMSYTDLDTGEIVKCQIFEACLPASDFGFVMAVRSQQIDDFIYAIECCLREIGGVPKIIVTDNLKSAVIKSDRYQPELNRIMEDFCEHYGCVTIPARAAHPKDKSSVEGDVKISYNRVYAPLRNRQFFSIGELNDAIKAKMKLHNQTRMQRISFTREERFIALDKPNLKPLRAEPFEIKYRVRLLVGDNSHVYMGRDKVYYSVPYKLIGQRVDVIYTRTLVNIYSGGEKVATHRRRLDAATSYASIYMTEDCHMPSYYNDYARQSPQRFIERASYFSKNFAEVMRGVFARNPSAVPETFYKSCEGLIHLQKTSDAIVFEKACEIALKYDKCTYTFIKHLVESKCAGYPDEQEDVLFPETHDNIRGREYYK